MEIKYLNINEIKPYEKNPRHNDKAVDVVATSIKEYGFRFPILLDKDNVIIAGHTRLKAAIKLGMQEVPTIQANDLTPEQVKALRIMDNKSSEYAEWDMSLLKEEIETLQQLDFDMGLIGLSEKELNRLLGNDTSGREDKIPTEAKYIVKPGDMYQLGEHILICGDATNNEDYARIMKGQKADLILTDPPYNLNFQGTVDGQFEEMKNDNMTEIKYDCFIKTVIKLMKDNAKPSATWYVWIDYRHYPTIADNLNLQDIEVMNCIVWDKIFSGLGYKYRFRHEFCVFAGIRNKIEWYGDTVDEDIIQFAEAKEAEYNLDMKGFYIQTSDGSFIRIKKEKIPTKRVPVIKMGESKTFAVKSDKNDNLIQCYSMNSFSQRDKEHSAGIEHPTIKPQSILKQLIINSTKEGQVVLDPMAGSGSTLIACEEMNRKARLIEIDPKYCSIIIERFENFTGQQHDIL